MFLMLHVLSFAAAPLLLTLLMTMFVRPAKGLDFGTSEEARVGWCRTDRATTCGRVWEGKDIRIPRHSIYESYMCLNVSRSLIYLDNQGL